MLIQLYYLFNLDREARQTGGDGGTPFKFPAMTPTEKLALNYLGTDKVFGFFGGLSTALSSEDEETVETGRHKQIAETSGML